MRERTLRVAARFPRLHRTLRNIARRRAGRHHVAAVAVVLDGDEVLLVEHVFRSRRWGLPGGWVNPHEDPFRAAEREVREELGIAVEAVAVVHGERQGTGHPGPQALTFAFSCRLVAEARPPLRLSSELSGARWVAVGEATALITRFELAAIERALSLRA